MDFPVRARLPGVATGVYAGPLAHANGTDVAVPSSAKTPLICVDIFFLRVPFRVRSCGTSCERAIPGTTGRKGRFVAGLELCCARNTSLYYLLCQRFWEPLSARLSVQSSHGICKGGGRRLRPRNVLPASRAEKAQQTLFEDGMKWFALRHRAMLVTAKVIMLFSDGPMSIPLRVFATA